MTGASITESCVHVDMCVWNKMVLVKKMLGPCSHTRPLSPTLHPKSASHPSHPHNPHTALSPVHIQLPTFPFIPTCSPRPNHPTHPSTPPICTALTPGQAQYLWAYSGVALCLVELLVCRIYGPFLPILFACRVSVQFLGWSNGLAPLSHTTTPPPPPPTHTQYKTGVDAGAVIPATIGAFFLDRFLLGGQIFDQFARVFFPRYKVCFVLFVS